MSCVIEDNRIIADPAGAAERGFGGLHIGGDSRDVEIRRNHIRNGNNHGITLGSVRHARDRRRARARSSSYQDGIGFTIVVDDEGCIQIIPIPPQGGPTANRPWKSKPALRCSTCASSITSSRKWAASGISVARFFDMETSPDFITVVGLAGRENRIRGCMRLEVGDLPSGLARRRSASAAWRSPTWNISSCATTRFRTTESPAWIRSPASSCCTAKASPSTAIVILDNGKVDSEDEPLRPGRRGGIVLAFARASGGTGGRPVDGSRDWKPSPGPDKAAFPQPTSTTTLSFPRLAGHSR